MEGIRITKMTRHGDGYWTANVNGVPFETSGPLWFTRKGGGRREALPLVRRALVQKQKHELGLRADAKVVVV